MDLTKPIKLRPHHLVCIQHFVGKGYSDGFVSNMQTILEGMNQNTPIQIVMDGDSLCAACPHNDNGVCDEQARVLNMDQACLSLLNTASGDIVLYGVLRESVLSYIEHENALPCTCADCQWFSLCNDIRAQKAAAQ